MSPATTRGPGWYGTKTGLQAAQVLLAEPLKVLELVGHRFTVSEDLARFGVETVETQRSSLTEWVAGMGGVVVSVEFTGNGRLGGWYVVIEHDDDALCDEERWPRLRAQDFIRRTWPEDWSASEVAA